MNKTSLIIISGGIVACIVALLIVINITSSYTAQYKFLTYEVPKNFVGEENAEFNRVSYYDSTPDKIGIQGYAISVFVTEYKGYYSYDGEALQDAYDEARENLTNVENINIDRISGIEGDLISLSSSDEIGDKNGGGYIDHKAYFLYDNNLVEIAFYPYENKWDFNMERKFNKFIDSIEISR